MHKSTFESWLPLSEGNLSLSLCLALSMSLSPPSHNSHQKQYSVHSLSLPLCAWIEKTKEEKYLPNILFMSLSFICCLCDIYVPLEISNPPPHPILLHISEIIGQFLVLSQLSHVQRIFSPLLPHSRAASALPLSLPPLLPCLLPLSLFSFSPADKVSTHWCQQQ